MERAAYERAMARSTLAACGVVLGADFRTLPRHCVEALLWEADSARYRKPRGANGSRARYFHDMLQRRARRLDIGQGKE